MLNIATLGMLRMEQMLDDLGIEEGKRYMHHYNFPPFSTGEAGFMRGPKRREIGHGALAEKSLLPVVPTPEEFPYALRLVSEVLSSNGSTSMAAVCSSTLSLMDAGVPILAPVAGIAMGLIHQDGEYVTLTDIIGDEDFMGDMDFKVAGTAEMITALQLDTKIAGLPTEVLSQALSQARDVRLFILEEMNKVISEPRSELQGVDAAHRGDRDTQGQDRRGDRPQGQDGERTRGGDGRLHRDRGDRGQGDRAGRIGRRSGPAGSGGENQPDCFPAPARGGQGVRGGGGQHNHLRRLRQHTARARRSAAHLQARLRPAGQPG